MELPVDQTIKKLLDNKLSDLEKHLNANVLWFYGPIYDGSEQAFLELVEQLADEDNKKDTLYIILTTPVVVQLPWKGM